MSDDDELWVDSADRKVALRALDEHHDEAHLTDDEHSRRSELVRAAENRADLRALFADLPPPHPLLDDDLPKVAPSRAGSLAAVLGSGGLIVVGALIAQWWIPAIVLAVVVGVVAVFTMRR